MTVGAAHRGWCGLLKAKPRLELGCGGVTPVIMSANDINITHMLKIPLVRIEKHVWVDDRSMISLSVPRTGSPQYQKWGLLHSLFYGLLAQ